MVQLFFLRREHLFDPAWDSFSPDLVADLSKLPRFISLLPCPGHITLPVSFVLPPPLGGL